MFMSFTYVNENGIIKVGKCMQNIVLIKTKDGREKEIILPEYGSITIQTQNGKIIFIDELNKHKV